ncbi:MAG: ferric reductase-like transmembrane domain-containing protein [Anaerolineales bacterium]
MPLQPPSEEYPDSSLTLQSIVWVILAIGMGTLAAVLVLPSWMPHLAASLLGPDPKAYWYLSRGSAFVALSLLWLSMALGLLITNKIARTWPGVPVSFALHEFISILGLGFALFHALILMGDRYIGYTLAQVLVPFSSNYEPFWVGLGQVGFYTMLIVTLSFYVRSRIGQKTWRALHYISFITYLIALLHGITSGSDTSISWAQQYYWISGGALLFLLCYRIVANVSSKLAVSST